jgi:hypothetical protein
VPAPVVNLLDRDDTDTGATMGGSTSISAAVTNKALPALKSLNMVCHIFIVVDNNMSTYT